MLDAISDMRKRIGFADSSDSQFLDSSESQFLDSSESQLIGSSQSQLSNNPEPLNPIMTSRLHRLIVQSERWRNYSFNMGYELSQFKKMVTMCEDATIKVRRLLHNFEERM